jgi:hypothetical protein
MIKKLNIHDYYEAVNKHLINIINDENNNDKEIIINGDKIKLSKLARIKYYDENVHEEFVKFVTNNHLMINPFNEKLIDERLKDNLKWSGLKNYKDLDFYIENVGFNEFTQHNCMIKYDPSYRIKCIVNKFNNITEEQFRKLISKFMNFDNNVKCNFQMNSMFIKVLKELKYKYFFNEIQDKYFDELKDEYITIDFNYVESYIKSKSNVPFEEILKQVHTEPHYYDELACMWCEYRKCDPPFDMWPQTPNRDLQRAYRKYISEELPKEYTDVKYYNYMMKNRRSRSEHGTNVYTLFSNNIENKIIFVDASKPLDEEYAELRFSVDIDYSKMKKFLGEQLNINNITTRTRLSDYDFNKVCGGDVNIDCFVFSDVKNIYKEITPLLQLLEFFKAAIETKFNVKIIMNNNDDDEDGDRKDDKKDDKNNVDI